ncbi:hypothetical protein CAI21_16655 [Alkalilimnicola ehrlichii]|uniref:Type VI secretion system tube protein Hcp n=1 Tax=Alkalilimnicola ehrlichii TaxID=351052 RepID=A0A3E0WI83_9GAMM|nr:type VI secretion system tube protein TssD [Alkalilimnicola ehrlichii]RFA26593.1 hypothetical protein CAI21_16655 [Alkalilimnicola ehrlichii]RFA31871.1 hypothetical protein CAL65_21085 [Alkalilimnicola ehrlichii]
MALPAYIELYDCEGLQIQGGSQVAEREGTVETLAFHHCIALSYDPDLGVITSLPKHAPAIFVKPIDASSPYLMKACCTGRTFAKVLIHWYKIDAGGSERLYFRHELKDARISSIKMKMHNVKELKRENTPPLEQIAMRYSSIKWEHMSGNVFGLSA